MAPMSVMAPTSPRLVRRTVDGNTHTHIYVYTHTHELLPVHLERPLGLSKRCQEQ